MRARRLQITTALLSTLLLSNIGAAFATPLLARDRQGQQTLKRIHASAQLRNYSGTFVYQQGTQMRTSRITHTWDGVIEREKLEILDGSPREFVRNNDQVVCYQPATHTMRIEQRMAQDLFPAMLANEHAEVNNYYVVNKGKGARIAGFAVQQLRLQARDRWRYSYVLWSDKQTALLLRMQTLDSEGRMIEQIAFTQLSMDPIAPARLAPSYPNTAGWRVERVHPVTVALPGWTVKWMPPGFKKIHQIKRLVSEDNAPISNGKSAEHARELSQMVYSDGIVGISVFIESGGANRQEGATREGAINILSKRYGQFWLTIVGEVPAITIKQIASSIQYKP